MFHEPAFTSCGRNAIVRRELPESGARVFKLNSAIDTEGKEFRANAAAMRALVAELGSRRSAAARGGPQRSRERHVSRGKILPRERVLRLLDPGSPFLELSP